MDKNLAKLRHERSLKDFPDLRLEDGEYVEFAFRRARICFFMIVGAMMGGLIAILLAFLLVLLGQSMIDEMGRNFLFIILFALLTAVFLMGVVSLRLYRDNKLYITNKHVTQFVRNSLVSSSINIIDLSSVEDVSFHQDSLLQKMFHYGTFRLSTIGDETTYSFKFSDISAADLRAVTKLLSEAKKESKKED